MPVVEEAKNKEIAIPLWEFADIGYDTERKLWFVNFFDSLNKLFGTFNASKIIVTKGFALQYEWKNSSGKWHVRERIFPDKFVSMSIDSNGTMILEYENSVEDCQPELSFSFAFVQYAYHLVSIRDELAPRGFIEFCNERGEVVRKINNVWIIIENITRETCGEFPAIRLKIKKSDIKKITLTESCAIISG